MASNKTSSNKKKGSKRKKTAVVGKTASSKRRRSESTSTQKTSSKAIKATKAPSRRKAKTAVIEEITEQISILEVMSDSAVAAKPFLLVFSTIFFLYLALALFSFNPNDIQSLTSGDVANWCGVLGVLLSTKLYSLFGYGAWIVLPLAALSSWMAAGRRLLVPTKMAGVALLYWNLLCVLTLLNSEPTALGFYSGGVLGYGTMSVMTKIIGTGGSWLLLSGLAVTVFIFVAGMELREIVERSLQRLEERGPDLGQRSLHWGQEVLWQLKENSQRLSDSIRNRFSRNEDEYGWDDESIFETSSVYVTEYTDDGVEFTEEDSLPPNSFDHSSEYEHSEYEPSEDFSYDYHTRELDADVTKTQVQNSEIAQVEFSESWEAQQEDSTFNPRPEVRQPDLVEVRNRDSISKEETLTDQSTAPLSRSFNANSMPSGDSFNPFADSTPNFGASPSTSSPSRGAHHLPAQEEIELPQNAWDEDLSEWYRTERHTSTNALKSPKQKMSALPQEPLTAKLSIRRPQIAEPEVGSVSAHLMGDGDLTTGELSSDEGLYDLPKPVAPQSPLVANESNSKVSSPVSSSLKENTAPVHAPQSPRQPTQSIQSKEEKSTRTLSEGSHETSNLDMADRERHHEPKSVEEKKVVKESSKAQSKPTSVSQLVEQVDELKSQARQMTTTKPATEPATKSKIPLPEREVTPAMAMIAEDFDLDEDSVEDFADSTPARAMVNPGNIESGGDGEVQTLRNPYADFQLPSLDMLDMHEKNVAKYNEDELMELADILVDKLADFKVHGEVETICPGPVITTFEFKPARGVRVAKVAKLADDIAMALRAVSVRIVAPIPGKDVVGIEIPNQERQVIWSRDMLGSKAFQESEAILPMAVGKDVNGFPYVTDLTKTPHLLVAGTTGSGKSVGINTMLISMLLRHSPETLRLILVDPKMLEFEMYNNIPHLLHPVVTDPHQASGILKWACTEMDRRYALMAKYKTRNIESFNQRLTEELEDWDQSKAVYFAPDNWDGKSKLPKPQKMPYIVVVIDELADLMMVAGKEVEESIIRIAQKARACGIHLIVATQRPSADVVTGLIKANMPSRMCFQVRQRSDSRIILDNPGGETLLGKGDMLYLPPGIANLIRCHGPFLSDDEVRRITDHLRAQGKPKYEAEVVTAKPESQGSDDYDEFYDQAVEFVCEKGYASTSAVQRQFRIGYNRAARMIEQMEMDGIISEQNGSKKRKILKNVLEP